MPTVTATQVTSFRGMEHIVKAWPTRTVWANKYVKASTGEIHYGESTSKASCKTIHRNWGWQLTGTGWTYEGVFELEITTTVTETKRTR